LGLEVFLGKEVAYRREEPGMLRKLFNETLIATLYGSLLSFALMVIFSIFYRKIDFPLFTAVLFAGILYGLERNLGGFLLGKEKVHIDTFYMLLSLFITAALILLFKDNLDITKIFLIRVFSLLIGVAGRFCAIVKGTKDSLKQRNFPEQNLADVRKPWKFTRFREIKFFWFFTIFTFFERQADLFILSLFIDEKILGGYFLSLRIYLTVNLLIEVLAQALTPFISRVFRGKENIDFKTFFKYLFSISLFTGILLGLILYFSRDLIIGLFNKNLIPSSSPYLAILAFVVPFKVGSYILGSIMSSSQYQKARFYINLFTTLVFLISLILFVNFYSAFGAVYARALFEVLTYVISLIFVYNFLKKPLSNEK